MKKISLLSLMVLISTAAQAAPSFPNLKLGLWEIKSQIPHMNTPMTIESCMTEETRKKMLEMSEQQHGDCDKPQMTNTGNTWVTMLTCRHQGTPVSIRSEITLQSDTHYTSVTTTDAAGHATTMHAEGSYKGPCTEEGVEIQAAPGMKFNAKQLEEIAKALRNK